MPTLSTTAEIEILASPEAVRSVFLDFARYNQWQKGWNVKLVDPSKEGSELEQGDALKVGMHGMKFNPYVEKNTPECFTWTGSVPGVLSGTHHFHFSESTVNPGGTTFTQSEEFQGTLTMFFWPWRNKKWAPSENWKNFNQALKKEVESVAAVASAPATAPESMSELP